MAERNEINQLRIEINDPPDIIAIQTVTDESALPTEEVPQTLFYDEARAVYWKAARVTSPAKYSIARLKIGDPQLAELIDSVGPEKAVCRSFKLLTRKLGSDMELLRSQVGSDLTQRQSVDSMFKYYKAMADGCEDDIEADKGGTSDGSGGNVGGLYAMKKPVIAGGLA